jgi:uncharacterized membrane protein (UPF0182 family)
MAQPVSRSRYAPTLVVVLGVLFAIGMPLVAWLVKLWVDYMWFSDLGQRGVFTTRITSQVATGLFFALAAFAVLYVNMHLARRFAPRVAAVSFPEGIPEQWVVFFERLRGGFGSLLDRIVLWGSVAIALMSGADMATRWQTFRLALSNTPFGYADPQFGKDVGFFVFALPAYSALASWMMGILFLTLVLTLAVHFADGAIQPWVRGKGAFASHVKAHVSVLLALIVGVWGFRYWIDIYKLNFSTRGQVIGASYTDVHAQLPAYSILIALSAVAAAVLLLNIRFKGWRLPALVGITWVAASILLGGVWPAITQAFIVSPNEQAVEAPYISRNIAMTRKAFGLDDVKGVSFPADESLTATGVASSPDTLSNVRLWDPNVVKQSYTQLQSIRPYYEFTDVDVDRYMIDGKQQQVLLAAREMDASLLPAQSKTWVNQHLGYTHGFGLVMSPVNSADSRGLPNFTIGNIPPATKTDLKITEPRIYFGEATGSYAIVDTDSKEFDYPVGETNAYYQYKGKGGIPVGGLLQRAAWALHLGDSEVLFSQALKPTSRVLLRRDLPTRLKTIAPWLAYERDPYPVLVKGRIVWVIDAYTVSSWFPYSEGVPNDASTRYMRNSVKVTVDAFDGTTTFYAFDSKDPILVAWRKIFPGLITDGDKIPADIRAHFRYPQGIFEAQAEVYRTYHMTDPRVFYNKEDQWEIPGERAGNIMQPFYVLMRLPGETQEHFYLMQPYTPRNRDNMIGWVAANSDPEKYGQRTVYLFPKERVVLGPSQVSARINQDSVISPQLSLWNQRGSGVILGNMLVIPIRNSIVYIQPLYLQATESAIPELTRVIVAYADKVSMEPSLQAALLKVFGEQSATAEGSAGASANATQSAGQGSPKDDASLAERLYSQAVAAQKSGDWATYGARLKELGAVLKRLAAESTTGTAGARP